MTVNANGTVEYTHDGSESTADGFTYTIEDVSGAVSNVAGVTLTVTAVNDAPALVNNALTLEEGETVTLDAANLSATDAEAADSALIFTVSAVSGGQFEEASGEGTAITSFTQQQLTDNEIRFVHDGGEAAPAYEVSVSDGVLNTAAAGASVTFTNVNDAPELVTNALTLEEGETVTLDAADLSATDAEATTGAQSGALMFTVSGVSGGQFEEASASGAPITSFTQQQLLDRRDPLRARRGGGGAGVRGERERRGAEYRGGRGERDVHERGRRAGAGDQRADARGGGDGDAGGGGPVGHGRGDGRQRPDLHGVVCQRWAVRGGEWVGYADHELHPTAADRRADPLRARRGGGGTGVRGERERRGAEHARRRGRA